MGDPSATTERANDVVVVKKPGNVRNSFVSFVKIQLKKLLDNEDNFYRTALRRDWEMVHGPRQSQSTLRTAKSKSKSKVA